MPSATAAADCTNLEQHSGHLYWWGLSQARGDGVRGVGYNGGAGKLGYVGIRPYHQDVGRLHTFGGEMG